MINLHSFLNEDLDPNLKTIIKSLISLQDSIRYLDERLSLIEKNVEKMIKPLDELKKIMID